MFSHISDRVCLVFSLFWRNTWSSRTPVEFTTCTPFLGCWVVSWVPSWPRPPQSLSTVKRGGCRNRLWASAQETALCAPEMTYSPHLPLSFRLINTFNFVGKYADRSVGTQGGYQAAGTCVAVAFGLVGGAIVGELWWFNISFKKCSGGRKWIKYPCLCFLTGFILKFPIWGDPADDNCFDDEAYWEVRVLFFHQMVL